MRVHEHDKRCPHFSPSTFLAVRRLTRSVQYALTTEPGGGRYQLKRMGSNAQGTPGGW
jgi:hypothetical protein